MERVSWADSKIYTGLSREAIKEAPEYIESRPVTRDYENRLYLHYRQPPYWLHGAEHKSALSLSGV
jgi:stress response protein YsnF